MNDRTMHTLPGSSQRPACIGRAADPDIETHFPNRVYQFVWRNWELANLDRMALVAHARPQALRELGRSMGLPPKPQVDAGSIAAHLGFCARRLTFSSVTAES